MDKTEIIQQYLDNELSTQKRAEVDELLRTNQEAHDLFIVLRNKRETTLDMLNQLNPKTSIVFPPVPDLAKEVGQKYQYWKIAATIVVLIGISLSLWLLTRDAKNELHHEQIVEMHTIEDLTNDLDYYISPNRCWNERKLVWTIIEIK